MDLGPFGFSEILFVGLLALVVFGPRRLPEIGHAAGRAVSKLKRAANELRAAYESELDEESRQQIGAARRGLSDVKETLEAAGRDLWREGTSASRAVDSARADLKGALGPPGDGVATDSPPGAPPTGRANDDRTAS